MKVSSSSCSASSDAMKTVVASTSAQVITRFAASGPSPTQASTSPSPSPSLALSPPLVVSPLGEDLSPVQLHSTSRMALNKCMGETSARVRPG